MKKNTVLVLIDNYLPGYKSGGPVQTVANMVAHLSDEFEFLIFTLDRDALDTEPYKNITANAWNDCQGAKVFYCSPEKMTFGFIKFFLRKTSYDILYINSFVSIQSSLYPLIMRKLSLIPDKPIVLAPRGQFSAGALNIKPLKKKLFIKFFGFFKIWQNLFWQASSTFEKQDIKNNMGADLNVFSAIDLPGKAAPTVKWPTQRSEPLKIIFLARIDPMKNLDYALNLLKKATTNIEFNIYGPIFSHEYFEKCKTLISLLPANVKATYHGGVEHSEVLDTMAAHDLFLLPTAGENYGHVILEALLAGTPVLIADTTPWRNLEKERVGWDFPLSQPDKFLQIIENFNRHVPDNFIEWRQKIQAWAIGKQFNRHDIEQNRQLFRNALQNQRTSLE